MHGRDGIIRNLGVASVAMILFGAAASITAEADPLMRAARIHAGITRGEAIALMGEQPSTIENQRVGWVDMETLYFDAGADEGVVIRLMFGHVILVKTRQGIAPWESR